MNARIVAAALLGTALGFGQSEAQPQESAVAPPTPDTSLYDGGDGLSAKTAVVIRSGSEVAGVRSEYSWISAHYRGAQRVSQALTAWDKDHRRYDIITIKTSDDREVVIWFDISAMYK